MRAANSAIQNFNFKNVGDVATDTGREPVQMGWYEFAAELCRGQDVIDVGCGMGEGLQLLSRSANSAFGIDLDPRLQKPNVRIANITEIESKSLDTVVCIDVIEHVEKDVDFAKELVRIARRQVLVSTPNWTVSRCNWPYHVREYMPHELYDIFSGYGEVEMYKGTGEGKVRYKVEHPDAYFLLNKLRTNPLTSLAARTFNHFLPERARIQSASFVRVLLKP